MEYKDSFPLFTVSSHNLSTSVGLFPRRSQVISNLPPLALAVCSQIGLKGIEKVGTEPPEIIQEFSLDALLEQIVVVS